jgi:hypothetical protein
MFSKTIRPLVQMVQTMINIPDETFLEGFANIVPQKLSCYQKNNMQINKKMMEQFQFTKDEDLISCLKKMMDVFAQLDTVKQKQLIHQISFNAMKYIVSYVQQITIFAEQKWLLLAFLKHNCFLFLLI